jgi:DNA-directed RNA polymerase subunit K/omega
MSEEETEYIEPIVESQEDNTDSSSSDEEEIVLTNFEDIEDINVFRKNYKSLLENNNTSKYLNKYEITKILSKRCEQLENGCLPLISEYEIYNNVYDIAFQELKDKKIPFILKRLINNKYEYFKLEDLNL